ncbi:hypothetical protein H5410_040338 [Solanum commersonii]|uniref:Uncharacterized protein n=1 Tax=Solanum commersonii TaxID=4109 RepID=A0A9J5XRR9_SOLCO|nr:hypothetical protein H5410_040338 [Solanum commersonii]
MVICKSSAYKEVFALSVKPQNNSKSAFASKYRSVSGSAFVSAKTDGSKFCIVVKNILDVTAGSMRHVTRNQAKLLGNKPPECHLNLLFSLVCLKKV